MSKNALINLLPKDTQERFLSKADLKSISLSQLLGAAEAPTEFIYFPVDGFISIVQGIDAHPPLEVGMIGREGVLGAEVILGINQNIFGSIVQGAGNAWRISLKNFMSEIQNTPELHVVINAYLAVRMNQLGISVACEHFHEIGPRLAKWLLMSQDRAQSPTFMMTHEFIALMLGVRRVGITTTAADFRRRGLIEYHRGEMKVLNRVALKAEACSCYQKNRKIYSSLFD